METAAESTPTTTTESLPAQRRRFGIPDVFCAIILIAATVTMWNSRLSGPLDLRYDAGVYFILGTSIAQGHGYCLLNEPGDINAIQYPPLLSVFVAAHEWVLRTHDPVIVGSALRISYFVICLLYSLLTYALARRYLHWSLALFVGLVPTLSMQGMILSNLLFAEIPFALLTVAFIIFATRQGHRKIDSSLAGLFAVLAFLMRSVGVAALIAWVGQAVIERRFKSAAIRCVVAAVPILAWQGYVSHVRSGPQYEHPAYPYQRASYQYYNVSYVENILLIDPFTPERGVAGPQAWVKRLRSNVTDVPVMLGESVMCRYGFFNKLLEDIHAWKYGTFKVRKIWATGTMGLLGCAVALGMILLWLRRIYIIPLYVVTSFVLISTTPWPSQFARYVNPLAPFLALALGQLLSTLWTGPLPRFNPIWLKIILRSGAVLIIAFVLWMHSYAAWLAFTYNLVDVETRTDDDRAVNSRMLYYDEKWRAYDASLQWLKHRIESGGAAATGVIATSAPHVTYLETNQKAVMAPFEPDVEKAQTLMDAVPVRYVIVDSLDFVDISRRYAAPVMAAHPSMWQQIYRSENGLVTIFERITSNKATTRAATAPATAP